MTDVSVVPVSPIRLATATGHSPPRPGRMAVFTSGTSAISAPNGSPARKATQRGLSGSHQRETM